MARSIMDSSAEVGVVLEFCKKMFKANCYKAIASDLLTSLENFELNCCVRVKTDDGFEYLCTGNKTCSPMEMDLLNAIEHSDRIVDFGKRAAYNFNHVLLLIKNVPLDDNDRYGRYRDHIAIILDAAASRIENLIVIKTNESFIMDKINHALSATVSCLNSLSDAVSRQEKTTTQIMNNLLQEVTTAFSTLALTAEQEEFFIDVVNNHFDAIIEMFTENHNINTQFDSVIKALETIGGKKILS